MPLMQITKKRLICASVFLLATLSLAESYTYLDDGTYQYRLEGNGEVCLTKVHYPVSHFIVPRTISAYLVTSIGSAFSDCTWLNSVTIPSSVKEIGDYSFEHCTNLRTVKFEAGVDKIGRGAFEDCGKLEEIVLPFGLQTIGAYAFKNCESLARIVIPNTVVRIGEKAFEDTKYYDDRSQDGLIVVDGCLIGCNGSAPERCVIDDGIRLIADGAFDYNVSMKSVKIPEGVMRIGSGVFAHCIELNVINIPNSVNDIGADSIVGTSIMKNAEDGMVVINGCILAYKGECPQEVLINDGIRLVAGGAFKACATLTRLRMQDCVSNVCEYAFSGCANLEFIEMSKSIKQIGYAAFSKCESLKRVCLPQGITRIDEFTFSDCSSIEEISIPNSVTTIGKYAFARCPKLAKIHVAYDDQDRVSKLLSAAGFDVSNVVWQRVLPLPMISPSDGTTFEVARQVTISTDVKDAVIHYTTDGSDPTIDSPVFKKFTATGKMTIKAITEYDGMVSDIAVSRIGLGRCEQPRIASSLGRNFTKSGNVVSISCGTAGAEVHYTIDGEMPTVESPLYTGPFEISETMTVRAAALNHPQYLDSEEAHESFTREWIRVDTPFINAPSSFAGKAIKVTIGCSCEGATIYYTTDGSDPMANGLICTGEFEITDTTAIRAVAIKKDYLPSYESALTIVKNWTLAEAINVEGLPVSSEKPSDWLFDNQVAHDGRMSVRSGEVPDDEAVDMRLSINGVGKLSFWWKASCEETDMPQICWWDYGTILIDGVEVAWIDGEADWEHVEVEVPEGGEHQIVWRYSKDSDGHDGEDCLWIDEVSWTPKEVIDDLAQLSDVFGVGSEIVQCVKSDAELSSFNSFLSSCGVSQASSLSEAQKKWAYRSFKLSSIMVSPIMFEAEPELKIDTFSPAGSDWSICISLSAGGLAVEMAKDKLKERIRVGTSVEDICIQPNILAMPSADGTQLQFTIELPRGLQGFATVRID